MSERPELIIDRQKWARGMGLRSTDESALMLPNETFCCLGFACLQNGLQESDILSMSMPAKVAENLLSLGDKFGLIYKIGPTYLDSKLSSLAADINDNASISDRVREERLIHLFDQNGIDIKFIN